MLQIQQELRLLANNQVRRIVGSGAPVDGTTGVPDCGPGSTYTDIATGYTYRNIGTAASPIWSAESPSVAEKTQVLTFTTAQVNAGGNIVLPALAGRQYLVNDITLVAQGGNASGATAVVVQGTIATVVSSLLSMAVAGLTRSVAAKTNSASATLLADGASFGLLDAGTAVTLGKTGGSLATATGIMVIISYTIK